jgi:hypothetical protein
VHPKMFRLTGAKKETLTLLAEFFCLRTNDLVQIRHSEQKESYRRSMRRTLQLLAGEKLVNRLPYLDLNLERGGITYAYGLSDKGVNVMRDAGFIKQIKSFDQHSQRTLDHELEISFFHVALKDFCNRNELTLFWQQKDLKCTVNPDAYFAITDPKRPEGKNTLHYFLEVERAKIGSWKNGEPQILRKLGKYYSYFNTTGCEKEWGNFRQFRVIVVQRTDEKREFLLSKLAEKYKHRMFWLTAEQHYKNDIGATIFKTPRDFQSASYSFVDA